MIVILVTYQKTLDEVEKQLVPHRAFLDSLYQKGLLLASGPQNPRTGGVILCRGNDRAMVEETFKQDPFAIHGIGKYQFIEFEATKHAPGFDTFLRNV